MAKQLFISLAKSGLEPEQILIINSFKLKEEIKLPVRGWGLWEENYY